MDKIKVRVPATSANLGSGFDCCGIALELYNVFEYEKIKSGVEFVGWDKAFANESNLAYLAYKAVCDKIGVDSCVKITIIDTGVPVSRGLGSSATLICSGAYAANKLHGMKLSKEEVFEICTELEGHPDNVAPALFGAFCTSVTDMKGNPYTVRTHVSKRIHFTVLIPDFEVQTHDARAVLPQMVKREDAVYNMSRVALLASAFKSGSGELLRIVTRDRLHQQYRRPLFKNIDEIEKCAYECGAISFMISGAGSTCLCLSTKMIEEKLNDKIKDLPNGWVAKELKISKYGTKEVE
ncbi:MAG: homoserine kinase [Ruminococcaceae bacterium]|nr:homoserine kinase [Oscillospiraceae bacterium]